MFCSGPGRIWQEGSCDAHTDHPRAGRRRGGGSAGLGWLIRSGGRWPGRRGLPGAGSSAAHRLCRQRLGHGDPDPGRDEQGTEGDQGREAPVAIAITPDGQTAYVVNETSGTVTPIRIATNTAGKPIKVGNGAFAIAITPDGRTRRNCRRSPSVSW